MIRETYERQPDGSVVLIKTENVEAPDLSQVISDKEQQLLDLYEEIQKLKEQQ